MPEFLPDDLIRCLRVFIGDRPILGTVISTRAQSPPYEGAIHPNISGLSSDGILWNFRVLWINPPTASPIWGIHHTWYSSELDHVRPSACPHG